MEGKRTPRSLEECQINKNKQSNSQRNTFFLGGGNVLTVVPTHSFASFFFFTRQLRGASSSPLFVRGMGRGKERRGDKGACMIVKYFLKMGIFLR